MSGMVKLVSASPSRRSASSIEDCFADLHPEKYWRGEKYYRVLFSSKRLIRYIVLDVELCVNGTNNGNNNNKKKKKQQQQQQQEFYNNNNNHNDDTATANNNNYECSNNLYMGPHSGVDKYALADVEVARESDMGETDETFQCTTHLGNLLQAGDVVLGYDLISSVLPGADEWSVQNSLNSHFIMPDVVLVKKVKGNHKDDDDGTGDDNTNQQHDIPTRTTKSHAESRRYNKSKGSSSLSKRRERKSRRHQKKQKDMEDAAVRMGFLEKDGPLDGSESCDPDIANLDDTDTDTDPLNLDPLRPDNDLHDELWENERKTFEKELENDPDLAEQLKLAELELDSLDTQFPDKPNDEDR